MPLRKLISKALLAVALDKRARTKLEMDREARARAAGTRTSGSRPDSAEAGPAKPRPAAKKAAAVPQRADAPLTMPAVPAGTSGGPSPIDRDAAVTDRLDQADRSERRQLIRNAIRLRQEKADVLEALSPEQRRQLQVAGLQAIIERAKAGRGRS